METAGDLAARTYCSCHVAMMKMMILRTYKCNSLDCFDSNMCLIYYSRHGAMMKMMILRTYKCNSLDCFDSNMCLTHYSRHVAMMNIMHTCSIDVLILAADKLYIFTSFIILVDFSSSF